MDNVCRIIKKYPNRRLYDTQTSRYITLEDIRQLVLKEIPIQVVDARTQEDLTYNTLLQIIMEGEEKGPSFFSTDILQKMIRFYGGSMQEGFRVMLEQWGGMLNNPPSASSGAWQHWQTLQQEWMKTWAGQMRRQAQEEQASQADKPRKE